MKYSIIVVLFIVSGCKKDNAVEPNYVFGENESGKIRVAVYIDTGVWDACKASTQNMLREMKCNFTVVNRDSILSGNLLHYDLLLMPGGDMWTYNGNLTSAGMTRMKQYVDQGRGYIGICGGAYFAATKIVWRGWAGEPRINVSIGGLNLFSGIADGPIEDFAPTYDIGKCKIQILNSDNPIIKDVPGMLEMYYAHGPMFLPYANSNITVIGETFDGNKNVIIAFQCTQGKVFLTGLHPEFDDTHISWKMIKNAILWCGTHD